MKIRKIFLGLLLGLFSAEVITAFAIHLFYYSSLPAAPEEKTGHIYRMVVNGGFVRYGSARELYILQVVRDFRPVALLLFLLAIVLGMSWGIFKIAPGRKLNE